MMNLYHLKYFCDACRNQSVSVAADLNRVSHSAVSQAIRALETQLDVKLLEHARRRFEVSPAGLALFAQSDELFQSLEKTLHAISAKPGVLQGPLRLGLSHSVGFGAILESVARFTAGHSGVTPSIRVGNSTSLEGLLRRREIDLGFGIEDGSFAGFDRLILRRGKFILAQAKPQAQARNARGMPTAYLIGDKGPEVRTLLSQLKKAKDSGRLIEVQSWGMAAQLAEAGMGAALLPDFLVPKRGQTKLVEFRTKYQLPSYELAAFSRDEEKLSSVAKAFLAELRSAQKKKGAQAPRKNP